MNEQRTFTQEQARAMYEMLMLMQKDWRNVYTLKYELDATIEYVDYADCAMCGNGVHVSDVTDGMCQVCYKRDRKMRVAPRKQEATLQASQSAPTVQAGQSTPQELIARLHAKVEEQADKVYGKRKAGGYVVESDFRGVYMIRDLSDYSHLATEYLTQAEAEAAASKLNAGEQESGES